MHPIEVRLTLFRPHRSPLILVPSLHLSAASGKCLGCFGIAHDIQDSAVQNSSADDNSGDRRVSIGALAIGEFPIPSLRRGRRPIGRQTVSEHAAKQCITCIQVAALLNCYQLGLPQ